MPGPIHPRKLPQHSFTRSLIHSFTQGTAVRPHAQPGSSRKVDRGMKIWPWGGLLSRDICVSFSGSAHPSKGTGTNLDPGQCPQALSCEPGSCLHCPAGPSALLQAQNAPAQLSDILFPNFLYVPVQDTPLSPHTKRKSPRWLRKRLSPFLIRTLQSETRIEPFRKQGRLALMWHLPFKSAVADPISSLM